MANRKSGEKEQPNRHVITLDMVEEQYAKVEAFVNHERQRVGYPISRARIVKTLIDEALDARLKKAASKK